MHTTIIPTEGNALRKDAVAIATAGYAAIDVGAALLQKLTIDGDNLFTGSATVPLGGRHIFFVGIGKCAISAAAAIEKLFGERLTAGIALDVANPNGVVLSKIELLIGTHPLPSDENMQATERILTMLSTCEENDLVIMLVSGGGSTLLCQPASPMTPADESTLFKELTGKGATIQELNTVRKHTSTARGGGLAKAAYPAEVLSFIVSDVPGNDVEYISSGPDVRDTSSIALAQAVLMKYALTPPAATTFIETPKEAKYFERVTNILLLANGDGLRAMQAAASELGYAATVLNDRISGEARTIGLGIVNALHGAPSGTAWLYGGETTVTLDAGAFGKGGRNQEMALAALADIRDDELLFPFASDGHDNTDYAGAIADAISVKHAKEKKMSAEEYLAAHRSYDFFTATGDAAVVGYTGSNVSDFIIALKK